MTKPSFVDGLKGLQEPEPPSPAPTERKTIYPPVRQNKVIISGYFELPVRQQLAILAARQNKSQLSLLAEALNLLFQKHGESEIARG